MGDEVPLPLEKESIPKQCPVCKEGHDRRGELCWVCNRLKTSAVAESRGYIGESEYDS